MPDGRARTKCPTATLWTTAVEVCPTAVEECPTAVEVSPTAEYDMPDGYTMDDGRGTYARRPYTRCTTAVGTRDVGRG